MNHNHTSDDLAWQADRFLLEELSPAEQAEFAQLLANDQVARETVAAETLLLGTLAQLEAADYARRELVTPAGNHARGQSFHRTWIASGLLAASLLLAAMLLNQPASTDMSAGSNDLADNRQYEEVKQLVSLWSETSESAESLSAWDAIPESQDTEVVEESIAPDWMIAAVEAESNQGSAATEEDEQWQ